MKQYVGLDVSQKETSGLAWGHPRPLSVEDEWQGRRLPPADRNPQCRRLLFLCNRLVSVAIRNTHA